MYLEVRRTETSSGVSFIFNVFILNSSLPLKRSGLIPTTKLTLNHCPLSFWVHPVSYRVNTERPVALSSHLVVPFPLCDMSDVLKTDSSNDTGLVLFG